MSLCCLILRRPDAALWLLVGAVTAMLAGCGGSAPPPPLSEQSRELYADRVLLQADRGYRITAGDLLSALQQSKLAMKGGGVDSTAVYHFLDSLAVDSLTGFWANDEVNIADYFHEMWGLRVRWEEYLKRKFIDEKIFGKVKIDSQEVADFYYSRPDLFSIEEQVYISHILIAPQGLLLGPDSAYYRDMTDPELDAAARDLIYKVHELLDFGASFSEMAFEYSHDIDTRQRGGELSWITRNFFKPPFDSVAFSLEPGEYSEPYHDEDGWHIVLVRDYLPAGIPPIEMQTFYYHAEDSYRQLKANEIGKPLLDSIYNSAVYTFNEAVLDTDPYQVDDSVWAGTVNGTDTVYFVTLKNREQRYRRYFQVPRTTAEMKKEMVREAGRRKAVVQAAKTVGIDTLPESVERWQYLQHIAAKSVAVYTHEDLGWQPSDSAVEMYFKAHESEFVVDKPMVVQQILVEDSVVGEYVRDQANSGVDFLGLAEEFYVGDPSVRRELADLGPIGPNDVSEVFFEAARRCPVGEATGPVRTDLGFHVIKVLERRRSLSLREARGRIATRLREAHQLEVFNRFRDKLYAKYNVRFPESIRSVHLRPYRERSYGL